MKKKITKFTTAALTLAAVIFITVIGERVLSFQLKEKLKGSSISQFNLNFKDLNVNLFLNQIKFEEVRLHHKQDSSEGTVKEIVFSGFRVLPFIFKGEVVIDEAGIHHPVIFLSENWQKKEDDEPRDIKTAPLHIKKLYVDDAILKLYSSSSKPDTTLAIHFDIEITDISTNQKRKLSFQNTYFEKLNLNIRQSRWNTANGLYSVIIDSAKVNTQDNNINIHQFNFKTRYKKYEVSHIKNVETDWFDFLIQNIELNNVNFEKALGSKTLILSSFKIGYFKGTAFRDKRLPFPQKPDTPLLQELIENLDFGFHFDSLILEKADIIYQEHVKNATIAGEISFNNLQAELYQVGNVDSLKTAPTRLVAQANVMNKPLLKAEIIFPEKQNKNYKVSGNVTSSNMNIFNPMLIPNASFKVKKGKIEALDFYFEYNNLSSSGNLNFKYNNLKVEVINPKNQKGKAVKSFFINQFAIKDNNIPGKKSYKTGEIKFERDRKKSIFNYWWKSLLSGIKDTVLG